MAKKKWGVTKVALVCEESKTTNYFTKINKTITPKLRLKKYCPKLQKHTRHSSKEKLK